MATTLEAVDPHDKSSPLCKAVLLDATAVPESPATWEELQLTYTLRPPVCAHHSEVARSRWHTFSANLAEITLKVLSNRREAFRRCSASGEPWSQALEEDLWQRSFLRIVRSLNASPDMPKVLDMMSGPCGTVDDLSVSNKCPSPMTGNSSQVAGLWEMEDMFESRDKSGIVFPCSDEKRGVVEESVCYKPVFGPDTEQSRGRSDYVVEHYVQVGSYVLDDHIPLSLQWGSAT